MSTKKQNAASIHLRGFTLIELLTVIAIIGILAAILIPVLSRVRDQARRAACASNVRQIALAAHLYASDNEERLPAITAGFWPWDIDRDIMEAFSEYAGKEREMFYCPSSRGHLDPVELWEGRGAYIVTSYVLLVEGARRVDPAYTNRTIGEPPPIQLPGSRSLHYVSATQRELVVDAVISNAAGTEFRYPSSTPGVSYRYANHMEDEIMAGGANIAFLDGSVRWRPVSEMSIRTTGAPPFWW